MLSQIRPGDRVRARRTSDESRERKWQRRLRRCTPWFLPCCLYCLIFVIAVIVALSLIPLYLPSKDVTVIEDKDPAWDQLTVRYGTNVIDPSFFTLGNIVSIAQQMKSELRLTQIDVLKAQFEGSSSSQRTSNTACQESTGTSGQDFVITLIIRHLPSCRKAACKKLVLKKIKQHIDTLYNKIRLTVDSTSGTKLIVDLTFCQYDATPTETGSSSIVSTGGESTNGSATPSNTSSVNDTTTSTTIVSGNNQPGSSNATTTTSATIGPGNNQPGASDATTTTTTTSTITATSTTTTNTTTASTTTSTTSTITATSTTTTSTTTTSTTTSTTTTSTITTVTTTSTTTISTSTTSIAIPDSSISTTTTTTTTTAGETSTTITTADFTQTTTTPDTTIVESTTLESTTTTPDTTTIETTTLESSTTTPDTTTMETTTLEPTTTTPDTTTIEATILEPTTTTPDTTTVETTTLEPTTTTLDTTTIETTTLEPTTTTPDTATMETTTLESSTATPDTTTIETTTLEPTTTTLDTTTIETTTLESTTIIPDTTTLETTTLEPTTTTPDTTTIETTTLESTTTTPDTTTIETTTMETTTMETTTMEPTTLEPTTTVCQVFNITRAGDQIIGLYNTTAGKSTGGANGRYPVPNEWPQYAIDGDTSTKYVNFGSDGCIGCTPARYGENTGFYITPAIGASIATGLQFATANDFPNRNPITVTLEGSNATTNADLNLGSSWTSIYSGPSGLDSTTAYFTYGVVQTFGNTKAYKSYRLLVTQQRGDDIAVQYSEVKILDIRGDCNFIGATISNYYIVGLYNTTAGKSTGGANGRYPVPNEWPQYALDNDTSTKYVNFGSDGCIGCPAGRHGENIGFYVRRTDGDATIVTGLQFATANDFPNRDPITVTLEGSNATTNADLNLGSSWTSIYSGPSGLNSVTTFFTYGIQQNFPNTKAYKSYRLLVTQQRGDEIAGQFSEVKLVGFN